MRHVLVLGAIACSEPRMISEPCTVDCEVRIHPPGIDDPASAEFHGKELARHGWDLGLCQSCHGNDFDGGAAGVSCLTCHSDRPTTCATCHGPRGAEQPAGNHAPHLAAAVGCAECHVVPASWDAPGHILGDAAPAEIAFGALANVTPPDADRRGPPSWDGATCRNVYCHGDVTPWFGGIATRPRWDAMAPRFTCDRCHGAPPPDHLRVDCASCHPGGAAHVDGVVDVMPPSEDRDAVVERR